MDVTIQIPTPTLVTGQHFKVRYREVGGAYSSYQNETNAPFTITGLTSGNYELEVILVNADESECPATIKTFYVYEPYECIDFTAEIVKEDQGYYLVINYTPPATNPPCGWIIDYEDDSPKVLKRYTTPTLPASGEIKIKLIKNQITQIWVRADQCNERITLCHNSNVPAAAGCSPIVITSVDLLPPTGGAPNYWQITINYNQSTPFTGPCTTTATQTGVTAGFPGGFYINTHTLPASPTSSFTFKVYVAPGSFQGEQPTFNGTMTDICGNSHYWSV